MTGNSTDNIKLEKRSIEDLTELITITKTILSLYDNEILIIPSYFSRYDEYLQDIVNNIKGGKRDDILNVIMGRYLNKLDRLESSFLFYMYVNCRITNYTGNKILGTMIKYMEEYFDYRIDNKESNDELYYNTRRFVSLISDTEETFMKDNILYITNMLPKYKLERDTDNIIKELKYVVKLLIEDYDKKIREDIRLSGNKTIDTYAIKDKQKLLKFNKLLVDILSKD